MAKLTVTITVEGELSSPTHQTKTNMKLEADNAEEREKILGMTLPDLLGFFLSAGEGYSITVQKFLNGELTPEILPLH